MRLLFSLVAIALLAGSPALAASDAPSQLPVSVHEQTPAVAKVVEFARASGYRTLVYFELDDSRPDGPAVVSMTILGQVPGYTKLFIYTNDKTSEFMQPFASEASASGKGGWRKISIVVDHDQVTVERGPSPGPISGIGTRVRAEADRAFPGHT